jgi:hypothetical protein
LVVSRGKQEEIERFDKFDRAGQSALASFAEIYSVWYTLIGENTYVLMTSCRKMETLSRAEVAYKNILPPLFADTSN